MERTLGNMSGFEYEINMDESYADDGDMDEWGMAFAWTADGKFGVEYNLCVEDGDNYSAIYYIFYNDATDHMEMDSSRYVHYEIDFDDADWEEKLKDALRDALCGFLEENESGDES